ncbi:uncharacterized protein EAE97_001124 [Botrytis byssoidea]|uniref:Transcription factor domain-containing protein n=1 Tax=Botrytis byssoidea TaxID=139641 RepID=A0A9P5M8C0_9HELO|nr:uncharacterized protein EAE97_001124 [Botrytis byssoidea]KAF7953725.1 hypothetical protein EAE97_001124 [Botrytis byssoidea]
MLHYNMRKACQPSPPMRRHRAIKKPPHHETSKLEAKLDDLVTLLKSNTQVTPIRINSGVKTITASAGRAVLVRSDQQSPFINIPSSVTAHQLRQERPFLWVAIMTVASNNSKQQTIMSKEARTIFAKEAFVEGTRTMDLLLAILVYTVWDRYFYSEQSALINLIQLSISMLHNLGLDKPPPRDPAVMLAYDLKGSGKPARLSRVPTNEERRALLGYYLLSSVSCYTLRKDNTLRWTGHSDECLKSLETEKELDTDAILVQLVKLRLITTRINDLPWSGGLKPVRSFGHGICLAKPTILQTVTLGLELHTTERSIYEIGLLQVHNAWINVFLSIPPAEYISFFALTYSNMTHYFLSAYRLTTLDNTDGNQTPCIEHLDVSSFLDQAGRNFAQVNETAGIDVSPEYPDSFSIMANRIRLIQVSWDVSHSVAANSLVNSSNFDNHELYDFSMEFSDGDWLNDLLDSHDEQLQWDP